MRANVFLAVYPALLVYFLTSSQLTPLDEYVHRIDLTYNYEVLGQFDRENYTIYNINLTSQTWKTLEQTSHPLWWHFLQIVVPNNLDILLDSTFLYMGLGTNGDTLPPDEGDQRMNELVRFALAANTVTVYLRQIPNQPIWFTQDPSGRGRSEDDAMAFPWRRYMDDQSDPEFLMWMAMTKACVAAMNTVTLWSEDNLITPITRFVLSGASKRAWTVYLAAAVDERVIAIAPQVLSLLNLVPNMHHHYRSLGGWTFAFADYWNENLTQYIDSPAMAQSLSFLDPYSYRDRLTMPKLIICGASDEFFMPDSNRFFFDDLQGPNFLMFLPNTGHTVRRSPRYTDMWNTMRNFYNQVIWPGPPELPVLTWDLEQSGSEATLMVILGEVPLEVVGWVANSVSTVRRDFRLNVGVPPAPSNVSWNSTQVQLVDPYIYTLTVPVPQTGWRAFYIEVQFAGELGSTAEEDRLIFTTECFIVPDTLPFPGCQGAGCWGTLV